MKGVGKSFSPGNDVCGRSEAGKNKLTSENYKYSAAGLQSRGQLAGDDLAEFYSLSISTSRFFP